MPLPYLASIARASIRQWSSTHLPSIGTVRAPGGPADRDGEEVDFIPGSGAGVADGVVDDESAFVDAIYSSSEVHSDGGFGEHRHGRFAACGMETAWEPAKDRVGEVELGLAATNDSSVIVASWAPDRSKVADQLHEAQC
jgi:hypothetical protein